MPIFLQNIFDFFKGLETATAGWPQYVLVPVVILCSIIGVVILTAPFVLLIHFTIGRHTRRPLTATASTNQAGTVPPVAPTITPITPIVPPIVPIVTPFAFAPSCNQCYTNTSCNSTHCPNMKKMLKEEVITNSIQLLRKRGISEIDIRKMMMDDFSLDSETIDRLMKN